MNQSIDLNADLGEGGLHDEELISLTSSVNIACGGHAGDAETIRRSLETSLKAGVAVGAHPGYEDRANFGRLPLSLPGDEVAALLERQLLRFIRLADSVSVAIHHVKPHGALYLQACRDEKLAVVIAHTTSGLLPGCAFYCPPATPLARAAMSHGLHVVPEGFADRRYLDNGQLAPRSDPRALITDPAEALDQALMLAARGEVTTLSGRLIPLPVRTLCVHGDGMGAVGLLAAIRKSLETAGITIRTA